MESDDFQLEFEVRDYECDLQGVVNNAVYLNYLEHARHRYLQSVGIDFAQLHERGCDLVVTRLEVDYKGQLRGGDRFVVNTRMGRQSRLRFAFHQTISRLPEGNAALHALVTCTALVDGRPQLPPELETLLRRREDT